MMTVKEAASKLFVCEHSTRRYIRTGIGGVKLKATQMMVGAKFQYRIRSIDLIEFKNYLKERYEGNTKNECRTLQNDV